MRANLASFSIDELMDFIERELEQFRRDREAGKFYGGVTLADLQKYRSYLQRAIFTERGRALYNELGNVLAGHGVYEPAKKPEVKPMYDVYKEMWGYGNYDRKN